MEEKDGVGGEEERDARAGEGAEVMREQKRGGEVGVSRPPTPSSRLQRLCQLSHHRLRERRRRRRARLCLGRRSREV